MTEKLIDTERRGRKPTIVSKSNVFTEMFEKDATIIQGKELIELLNEDIDKIDSLMHSFYFDTNSGVTLSDLQELQELKKKALKDRTNVENIILSRKMNIVRSDKKYKNIRDIRSDTLADIGLMLGITRERARQIELGAIKKLRHPKLMKLYWKEMRN